MNEGFLYVATGDEFIQESISSATRLQEFTTKPISIVSDRDVESDLFDENILISDPIYTFGDQITAIERTPYDKTIFFDTDIYVCGNVDELFDLLTRFDIIASQEPNRGHTQPNIPQCFPQYNTGVVGYKTSQDVQRFINNWRDIYFSDLGPDTKKNQPTFRKALFESELSIGTLPAEYNCRFNYPTQISGDVKILHGRINEVTDNLDGIPKLMDISKVANKVNETDEPRVIYPQGNSIGLKTYSSSILYRMRYSIKKEGILKTSHKIISKLKRMFDRL